MVNNNDKWIIKQGINDDLSKYITLINPIAEGLDHTDWLAIDPGRRMGWATSYKGQIITAGVVDYKDIIDKVDYYTAICRMITDICHLTIPSQAVVENYYTTGRALDGVAMQGRGSIFVGLGMAQVSYMLAHPSSVRKFLGVTHKSDIKPDGQIRDILCRRCALPNSYVNQATGRVNILPPDIYDAVALLVYVNR